MWRGLELARSFYAEVIAPVLDVAHTACLIGEGSEVLGYDTERSVDHEWGPRVQIFVDPADVDPVHTVIRRNLPESYQSFPTRWYSLLEGRVTDHVEVDTTSGWLAKRLPTIPAEPADTAAWLAAPQQHLLQLTAGAVFHDSLGILSRLRAACQWYPPDVWRWMIACQWQQIGSLEPFIGRALEVGDLRGARLLSSRLCRLMMEMVFLQERRYRPYDKWFGTAFAGLPVDPCLSRLIDAVLEATPTGRPDDPRCQALLQLADRQNGLSLTSPVVPSISDFPVGVDAAYRPYPVLNTQELINTTVESITDQALRDLPRVGAIDQLSHSDDVMINFTGWPAALAANYRLMLATSGRP